MKVSIQNKTIKAIACLFFLMCAIPFAKAYDFAAVSPSGQMLYYEILTDSTVCVTYPNHVGSSYYSGFAMPTGVLQIPGSVAHSSATYKVVEIGNYAFYACSGISQVILPATVASLGDNSFYACTSLQKIDLPNSVAFIGMRAFQSCSSLSELSMQEGLIVIGYLAFEGCSSLTSVTIPNSVMNLGNWAFCNCSSLDTLSIGTSLPSVATNAFLGCQNVRYLNYNCRNAVVTAAGSSTLPITNVEELVVGDSVQVVPQYAFAGASHLSQIYLGKSLSSVGCNAFANCDSVASIIVGALVPPTLCLNTFANYNAELTLPCGSALLYSNAEVWSNFTSVNTFFPFILNAIPNDSSLGYVTIVAAPTCSSPVAQISATPYAGYHFLKWQDSEIANPRNYAVTSDETISAIFVSDTSVIDVVVADMAQGSALGSGTYYYQDSIIIEAQANYGYHFTQWNDGNANNPRTIVVAQDSVLTASFAPNTYIINIESSDTVMGEVSGQGSYAYLNNVTIQASALPGYYFDHWSDGIIDNPRQLEVLSDSTIVAIFMPNHYDVAVLSNDSLRGSVSWTGNFVHMALVTLTASPIGNNHFVSWNDGDTTNPRQVRIISDTTFTAIFAPSLFQLSTLVDTNEGVVLGIGFYSNMESLTIEAVPHSHYHFVEWSDGVTSNPRLVTVISDTMFIPVFHMNDQFDIVANSSDISFGIVEGSGRYFYADTVVLTAVPQGEHGEFYFWTDGCTDNPRIVTVLGDAQYEAVFGFERHQLTLEADNNNGILYGEGQYPYGSEVYIEAVPYPGYIFTGWSDQITDNPRSVIIYSDTTFVAHFAVNNDELAIDDVPETNYLITLNHRHLHVQATLPNDIQVFDIQGRVIARTNGIDLSVQIPVAGLYFIQVGNAGASKIIVQ